MKKAFMRGVCALNLEAMTMFREGEEGGRQATGTAARTAPSGRFYSGGSRGRVQGVKPHLTDTSTCT
jgi:hypothetical protein